MSTASALDAFGVLEARDAFDVLDVSGALGVFAGFGALGGPAVGSRTMNGLSVGATTSAGSSSQ